MILTAALWLTGFGAASGWLAHRRARRVPLWVAYGAILGPVALLLLWAAPHGHCQTCHMPTQGWSRICPWCHEDVNILPVTARRRNPPPEAPSRGTRTAHPAVPPAAAPSPTVVPEAQTMVAGQSAQPTVRLATTIPTGGRNGHGPDVAQTARAQQDGSDTSLTRVLATATYVTGTARLEPGRRYGLALVQSQLQVLGPLDVDPRRVVIERPVADMEVSGLEGRLVLSDARRGDLVIAFMSVAGASLPELVELLRSSVGEAGR